MLVEVVDNGSGIDEEVIENIFNPFYTTKSEGLGLGLSICEKIINAHNGTLELENNDGQDGATAKIILELSDVTSDND